MASGVDVLTMLLPNGGWYISGNDYENIQFLDCEPITEAEFKNGFNKYDSWKTKQDLDKTTAKSVLLEKLGITAEEVALLLS